MRLILLCLSLILLSHAATVLAQYIGPSQHIGPSITAKKISPSCIAQKAKGILSVGCFGAVGDGVTNDTKAFEDAIAVAAMDGGIVYLPPGDYLVTDSLDVTGVHMAGVMATITLDELQPQILSSVIYSNGGATIENITVNANGRARMGIHVANTNELVNVIRDVSAIKATEYGFHVDNVMFADLERVRAENNKEAGFQFTRSSGIKIRSLSSSSNEGHGLAIHGDFRGRSDAGIMNLGFPKGIKAEHVRLSQNGMHGIYARDLEQPSVFEFFTITGSKHGMWLDGVHNATVMGVHVKGDAESNFRNRAFILTGESSKCLLKGNTVESLTGGLWGKDYPTIFIQKGSRDNAVIANFFGNAEVNRRMSVISQDRNTVFSGLPGYKGTFSKGWISHRDSPPTDSKTWQGGDFIFNAGVEEGGVLGWVCQKESDSKKCHWLDISSQ